MNEESEGSYMARLMDDLEPMIFISPSRIAEMERRYQKAAMAAPGTEIKCPCCGKTQIKATYHHKFCRNKGVCKNRYHNTVDEMRRERFLP